MQRKNMNHRQLIFDKFAETLHTDFLNKSNFNDDEKKAFIKEKRKIRNEIESLSKGVKEFFFDSLISQGFIQKRLPDEDNRVNGFEIETLGQRVRFYQDKTLGWVCLDCSESMGLKLIQCWSAFLIFIESFE